MSCLIKGFDCEAVEVLFEELVEPFVYWFEGVDCG